MNARESILHKLEGKSRDEEMPAPWSSRRVFPDPAERFTTALVAAHGEVRRLPSLKIAGEALVSLLVEAGVELVVADREPELERAAALAADGGLKWRRAPQSPEVNWREACAAAGAGVTGARALLAETGSLILDSGPGRSRWVSLLPPLHIALAPTRALIPDLFSWTAARDGEWPANRVLVSGPSKTGDIEQTLAVGVHGPRRFIVLLYDG